MSRRVRGSAVLGPLTIAAMALAAPLAEAQSSTGAETSADRTVYEAAFYAAFAPQTAYDIVLRTPGFVLDEGDDLRGFGATGGNVLVDGARPTSKSGGIEDALRRIPASQVLRVEILRGVQSSEAQGQALVLNIIRAPGASGGTWELEIERNGDGLVYPRASVTRAQSVAGWDTSLRANAFWEQFPFSTRRTIRDGAGDITATWRDDRPTTLTEVFVSGEGRRAFAGGILNLTGRFGWQSFYYDQDSVIFFPPNTAGDPDQTNVFAYDRADWNLEIGGDFTRNLGDWTWKLIGLASAQDYQQTQSDVRRDGAGGLVARSDLRLDQTPIELVGRTTFARATPGRLRPEFGGEIAFNSLESAFALSVDSGGGPVVVDLPAANVIVEELRGEAFASLGWTINDAFTLETRLAAETSEITVTGDVENSQSFTFVTPSAALLWRLNARTQLRFGAERTVGQLDFSDFAASAELQDDETVAGNPDLGPDQTTRVAASLDYRGGDDLALNVELFHEWRQDVLEQVLLPSGGAGLANAGDARFWGVRATLNAPLDLLLPNATLKIDALVSDSEFDDPLTKELRTLTGQRDNTTTFEFRQDFPEQRWSWGLDYELGSQSTTYLIDQIDYGSGSGRIGGFIETTRWGDLRVRLAVRSAATERYTRFRTFFDPDRSGVIVRTDDRASSRGAFVTFTIAGTF